MGGYSGWNSGLRTASQQAGAGAVATNTADAAKLSGQLDTLRGIYNPDLVKSNVLNTSEAANKLALTGGYNPVTPSTPDLAGRGRETYQSFSDTGGYTPEESSAFI